MRPETTALDLNAMQRMALMSRAQAELKRNPRNVEAWLTLAGLQGAEKNMAAAMQSLLKALAIKKKDTGILRRLVSAANDMNDMPTARKYVRKLIEIEPRKAEHHKSLGLVLEMMGSPAQAIESFRKADQLEPGSAQTLHDIGRCMGLMGEHEQAIEYFRKALEADRFYPLALYNYAVSRKFSREEADALIASSMESETRATSRADPAMHANLHYGMGKLYDETGRPAEAFEHFAKANALRDPGLAAAPVSGFIATVDAFRKEIFQQPRIKGHDSAQPIFICGMPRSGTTLTESLCGGHSMVSAGDEQVFMSEIAGSLGSGSDQPGAYRRNIEALGSTQLRDLGERYLASCKHIAGTTAHFTDKLPHNFMNIGLISLIFPNAKIILCRRHPLDNCFSLYSNSMSKFHNRYKTNLKYLGLYYRQYAQLLDHWRQVLPGRFHEVMYEDLVANTELNARAMIDYLGLEWENGVMERSGSQRSVRTLSSWQVRQPVYQTSKGKWKLYEKQLAPVAEAIGPYIDAYEKELQLLTDGGQPRG